MRMSWIREIFTPEIRAWNHMVTGKSQSRKSRPTKPIAIQMKIDVMSVYVFK
jgi:hypothetical protein